MWPEEPFEFPISAKKPVSISVETFFLRSPVFGRKILLTSDSRTMKIRVKVANSCLTLSKKPPPFRNPGHAPAKH